MMSMRSKLAEGLGNVIGNSEDFALMLVCVTLARDIECFQIKIERAILAVMFA
jgi:hypothetical protein